MADEESGGWSPKCNLLAGRSSMICCSTKLSRRGKKGPLPFFDTFGLLTREGRLLTAQRQHLDQARCFHFALCGRPPSPPSLHHTRIVFYNQSHLLRVSSLSPSRPGLMASSSMATSLIVPCTSPLQTPPARLQSYAPHIGMAFGWLHESLVERRRVHGPSQEAAWQLGCVFRLNDVQHRPKRVNG